MEKGGPTGRRSQALRETAGGEWVRLTSSVTSAPSVCALPVSTASGRRALPSPLDRGRPWGSEK